MEHPCTHDFFWQTPVESAPRASPLAFVLSLYHFIDSISFRGKRNKYSPKPFIDCHESRIPGNIERLVTRLSDACNPLIKSVEKRGRSNRRAQPNAYKARIYIITCVFRDSRVGMHRPTDFYRALATSPVHTIASK